MANVEARVLPSVIDGIGETPLVELARITGRKGRILAKLEMFSPGLSKKDRIARQIIEDAEAAGTLRPGQTVVELTSGNAGIGLAIVCAVKAYPFVAVMSKGNSAERALMMRALGAEVVLVDQAPDSTPGMVSGADAPADAGGAGGIPERDLIPNPDLTLDGAGPPAGWRTWAPREVLAPEASVIKSRRSVAGVRSSGSTARSIWRSKRRSAASRLVPSIPFSRPTSGRSV